MIISPAIIYTICTGIVILFQACLVAGLPWGAASMGGKYPGKYPPKMRKVAVLNMLILTFLAVIVLSKSQLAIPSLSGFSAYAIWFVVVFSALSSVLNIITPSKIERIWAPVAIIQFISSLLVALG